ncbi:MAG: hypothetical protein IIV05_04390 [Ruminococcus sp.]|nr:hypothetical protein [Ruminococcus sp.]
MKRYAKIAAGVLSLAMLGTMAACGAKTESQQSSVAEPQTTAAPATKDSAVDPLKGVFDTFVKNETYTSFKSAYTGAKFDEKLGNDGITITVTDSEYIDGEYKFPAKDGYLRTLFPRLTLSLHRSPPSSSACRRQCRTTLCPWSPF